MKKLFSLAAVMLLLASGPADAQFLRSLGNAARDAAKSAAERQVREKTDQAIDEAADAAYDAAKSGVRKSGERDNGREGREGRDAEEAQRPSKAPAADGWTCPECGAEGNTGKFCAECGAKKPVPDDGTWTCPECGTKGITGKFCPECGTKKPVPGAAAAPAEPQKQPASAIVWNNYDFVAGDQIIFDDNLETEQMGEFPSQMDLFQGNVQIVTVDGIKCINSEDGVFTPFFKEPYLTDECTIEMDIYMYDYETYIKNHPDIYVGINHYEITLATSNEFYQYDGNSKGIFLEISACEEFENYHEPVHINYSWDVPNDGGRRDGSFKYELKDGYNAFHHVAISFNKRACKIYFDEQRVANIPNAIAPKWVQFRGGYDYPGLYFWKNFRIAKGAVPLYNRLQNEGKIVTYGITFDTGKATIKSESMGEINRIKGIMDQDASLKFEVQGHCDNTGSAAVNDKLSQQRAEAIVDKLVEMGIAKDRLTAVGKGSRVPIADNSTDEGRAKNRRVEFVKQ